MTDTRLDRAGELYERAVFAGDASAIRLGLLEVDAVEADAALARGRLLHASYLLDGSEDPAQLPLLERAVELYDGLGDDRGLAEALFWVAIRHQVIHGDQATALPLLSRAHRLAERADDRLTLSYVLRHLCFVEKDAGRVDRARELMAESTQLRRDLGFSAGVAANLVGLAYLSAELGRPDESGPLLDEAADLADRSGAAAVLTWVEEARTNLGV
ncbi:MAG TPA: tetratricopeptide repeat protein [Nocardioides sp.]|jgi:hypothetical protein